ncbi:MAG: dihydropteroate synthase [Polyangia bacterium]
MGILNLTPDSFSDGGRGPDASIALARSWGSNVDIVDVGGESTRPHATPVSLEEELARVLPVVRALAPQLTISIDTYKAEVAAQTIAAGAEIINDVSGGLMDPALLDVVASTGAYVILGHTRGTSATMNDLADYRDVVAEVRDELGARVAAAGAAGVAPERIFVDPGLGFAKRAEHNLTLLAHLHELRTLGFPIVVGLSRKRFLAEVGGIWAMDDREEATAAAGAIAVWNGADVIRVHDVTRQARSLRVAGAIVRSG